MDWNVILDGFMVVMAWICLGFLLYGAGLAIKHQFAIAARPAESADEIDDLLPADLRSTLEGGFAPRRQNYERIERHMRLARRERSAAVGEALGAACEGLLALARFARSGSPSRLVHAFAVAWVATGVVLGMAYAFAR